ncbi:MAG TPA: hypothetical protein VGB85_23710 [Nannocystis sp.]|jgi:hypothetical protein
MTTPTSRTPTKAVFYFRTLDRWPGGNADMLTIKVTLRLTPTPALEAQFYSCFDGNHAWYPPRSVTIDAADALAGLLITTSSLAARGSQSLTITMLDRNEDEWDSEWAEIEVLLFAGDDGPETSEAAQLRLLRTTSKTKGTEPDPELEQAFELAQQVTGVGRVFQFANTQDALSAAYRAQGQDGVQDLDYKRDATPRYLPPETDPVFAKLRGGASKKQPAAAPVAKAPARETLLVYRLDEAPALLTRELPPDASTRKCLFYSARRDSPLTSAMYKAIPEPSHAGTTDALKVAARISQIASQSPDFARKLRPDEVPAGGSLIGGGYASGFHGGDAEAVERWLDEQGVTRISLRTFLDQLIVLRLVDEDDAPIDQVDKYAGGPPISTVDALDHDGLFVFERDRDHAEFKLAAVTDEGLDDEDDGWVVLHANDLSPDTVHTVVIPAAPASKPPAAKKTAAKKTATKKTAAKKTASKKTAAKKVAKKTAKKTAAKKTAAKKVAKKAATKKTATRKTATKKAAAKKAAAKKTTKKTAAKKAATKKVAKKAAAKKTAARKR